MNISRHAHQRLIERVSTRDRAEPVVFLTYLWLRGRPAIADDFYNFNCRQLPGREYRICTHKRDLYLVVFDPVKQTFVTLWKK